MTIVIGCATRREDHKEKVLFIATKRSCCDVPSKSVEAWVVFGRRVGVRIGQDRL